VGKSSIVNTLRQKKVCKIAPIAGETKVWQYVTLMERIYLIDCPGIVYPQGDSDTQIILKGVVSKFLALCIPENNLFHLLQVRIENVKDPENHVQAVLDRVKDEHLRKHYKLYRKDPSSLSLSRKLEMKPMVWKDAEEFMTKVALASGRLLKGGEPDIKTVAKMILSDFQRGNLPYYTKPPGCEDDDEAGETVDEETREMKEEELAEDIALADVDIV